MSKSLFLLLLFVFLSMELLSQTDLREGFIIDLENDTTFIQVEYRANKNNYVSCRINSNNNTQEYYPGEIKGYGFVEGRYYTSSILDSVFVEVLIDGYISLYRIDKVFYVKKNEELHKLESAKIRVEREGGVYTSEDKRWRGYLSYFISDCLENYGERIAEIDFHEKDITQLIRDYHICADKQFIEIKQGKEWVKTHIGANIGIISSNLSFGKVYNYRYLPKSFNSLSPIIGLSFIFYSPRIDERTALQTETNFFKSSFESFYEEGGFQPGQHRVFVDLVSLSIPVLFRYSIPFSKTNLNVNVGFVYNRYLSKKLVLKSSYWISNELVPIFDRQPFDMKNHATGLSGGLGVQRSIGKLNFNMALRYTYFRDLQPRSEIKSFYIDDNRWSILITIRKD
tara:strand:- start:284 stop:1474 length:1191 start_codon:yes stop_codon:yes gene_type:complete